MDLAEPKRADCLRSGDRSEAELSGAAAWPRPAAPESTPPPPPPPELSPELRDVDVEDALRANDADPAPLPGPLLPLDASSRSKRVPVETDSDSERSALGGDTSGDPRWPRVTAADVDVDRRFGSIGRSAMATAGPRAAVVGLALRSSVRCHGRALVVVCF